jgi:tetratricopeptide (TPR) repeat protein
MPELEAFAHDPGIRRAIERGSAHAVYRALYWARLLGRLGPNADVARRLLADRRLFLEPLTGAPSMSTFNGIGTMLHGRDDVRPDGTYVSTLFLVVIFLPVLPLSAYLVADGGGRSYHFLGRVPLGGITYPWRNLAGLGVVLAMLVAGASAYWSSRHATLHVVNGLPVPVVAHVAGHELPVAAEGHAQVTLEVGQYALAVRAADGHVIEEQPLEVFAGERMVAFNVLGAAPLFREDIVYAAAGVTPPTPEPDIACGQSDIHWGSVDYAFVDPPSSMSLSSHSSTTTRSHADVADGGWQLCAGVLASSGHADQALALTARVADATDYSLDMVRIAMTIDDGTATEATLAFVDRARQAHPDQVDIHRMYQEISIGLGRRAELEADYEARAAAAPDDADLAYLSARALTGDEGRIALEAASTRFPTHAYARRAYAYSLYAQSRWAESLAAWDLAATLDGDAPGYEEPRAACLVRLGRSAEALATLDRAIDAATDVMTRRRLAAAYAGVARATGTPDPGAPLRRIDFGEDGALDRLRATLEAQLPYDPTQLEAYEGEERDALELLSVASLEPRRALALAEGLSPLGVRRIPPELVVLLFAEATRVDAPVAAQHLRAGSIYGSAPLDHIARYVTTGEASAEIEDLAPPIRACVWLVRRRVEHDEAAREALLVRAIEDDALSQWASSAAMGWPAP